MDLIVKLPTTHSSSAYGSILVIVDKLTKFVRLIPCREAMKAAHSLHLVHTHWFSLFGLPEQIVSDCGSHLNNVFTAALLTVGIKQSLSTAYHPQTDGQCNERVNRVIEDMLRHYMTPTKTDWPTYLPYIKFAINNSEHEVTKHTPFS
jgi:transposase InsO family protein